jgi:hypothetical protein
MAEMTETEVERKTEAQPQPSGDHQKKAMMKEVAHEVVIHHLAPAPITDEVMPDFFPPLVMRGLGFGALIGGILGLIFGNLFMANTITVGGWDNMYSLAPAAFLTLWTMIGVAVGVVIIGIAAILLVRR